MRIFLVAIHPRPNLRQLFFQSALAAEAFITRAHLSISLLMCVANCSLLLPTGARASFTMRALMSAPCMILLTLALS
jgi:hypothetical protein